MTFDEVLEKLKGENPKVILDALEELEQASLDAWTEAGKARDDYYANTREKENKVADRIKELKKQFAEYQAQIDAYKNPLISATTACDQKKLASIRDSMKALEAEKVQISTEIEMLESAHIRGDEELYNKVLDRAAQHESLRKIYWAAKDEVYAFAKERAEDLEKIKNETKFHNMGGGYGVNVIELNRHFYSEKYAKLEE